MSFYSYKNSENEVCPGRINNDATKGLCERVCIQVRKVYDSCMQQEQIENIPVTLSNVQGGTTAPLTFTGCRSSQTQGVVRDPVITRLIDRPRFARVQATIDIPIIVTFVDANNVPGSGTAIISVSKDVILNVPDESIIPFVPDSIVSAICINGTFIQGTSFIIDACVTVILKIVADVELLIPSYGFCRIPPCEEYSTEVCDDFFNLPIFPTQSFDCCC